MLRIDINLIFTVINVLVLCAAVRIFLWKPIHKILDERQAQANAMLTDAAHAKEEAEALVEEHKASMADIEQEKAAAIAEAKSRADSIVREAETEGASRKEEIIRQAQSEITEIIVAATAKVAGVPVNGDSDLYDEFLKKAGDQHE